MTFQPFCKLSLTFSKDLVHDHHKIVVANIFPSSAFGVAFPLACAVVGKHIGTMKPQNQNPRTPTVDLKVACIGEAMLELSAINAPGLATLGIAGDVFNTAIYLRRALPKTCDVSFVTALGTDPMSDQFIDFVAQENILTNRIKRDPNRLPGIYAINTDSMGERSFDYWRDASAARTMFQTAAGTDFKPLEGMDVIYLSAITLAILGAEVRNDLLDWLQDFRKKGGIFAFDSNYRPRLWASKDEARTVTNRAWSLTDIALPSIDDEHDLFDETTTAATLDRFKAYGCAVGALKCGALGPLPINASATVNQSYTILDRVVDSTAAGDSFNAGFLASHLTGGDIAEALQKGHTLSTEVVMHSGAITPRPVHKY